MNDEELEALLADRALWVEPRPVLEDRVVAAVAAQSGAPDRTTAIPPPSRRRGRYALVAAAVAGLIVGGATAGIIARPTPPRADFVVALTGTDLAPAAAAKADLTRHEGGWRIYLDGHGLPRRAGSSFYEAWLKNDAGELVSVGTFNELKDVTLWAGVAPVSHQNLTVTREFADGNPASSGHVVLMGHVERAG